MSHTPAPWQLCTSGSNLQSGGYVLTEYFVCIADSDIAIAADIADPKTGEPSEANARLIAAAPDLLAALELLVAKNAIYHRLNDSHEWTLSKHQADGIQAAIDLIARIKDESK